MSYVDTNRSVESEVRGVRTQAAASLVSLIILVGLAYLFNLAIVEDVQRRFPDSTLTPLVGLIWSLMFSVLIAAIAIIFTKVLTIGREVGWWTLIRCYLISSGWHIISGLYAVYLWKAGAWPETGSIVVSLNLFGWNGSFGAFLNATSIDEVLHLVTYAVLVNKLARWRNAWWLYAALLMPWLAYTWLTSQVRL